MGLSTLIKRLQDIMRKDSGVDGDAQRLAQLVWMIFLLVFDYKEESAELDDDYKPVIPIGYRWRDWAKGRRAKDLLTGDELLDFVNNNLFPVLKGKSIQDEKGNKIIPFDSEDKRSLLVKSIITASENYMKNGYNLRDVINILNEVDFTRSAESHEFNEIYENLLKGLQSAGTMGEFYTGRAITRFVIDKIDPQIGGILADWACGTGGFLVDAINHMKAQIGNDVEKQLLLQKSVRGGEFKPMPYRLCVTNLLLNDIELPNITYGDSLDQKNLSDYSGDDLVEYAALNPPYGGVALESDLKSFPMDLRSSETADLFVALTVKRLKKDGRAGIVLPDGFLFGTDNAKVNIKKYLMRECNLHTIIRLPQSCFAPYTSIATNLLFFDKTGTTEAIWFYRLDMPEGYKHFSKTKPMRREHFVPVDEWWDNRIEIKDVDTDTYKAKRYTIEEIKANGYNLDLCGYPTSVKEILSPEDTIRDFMEHRAALNEKLDRQLNEILSLLGVKQ